MVLSAVADDSVAKIANRRIGPALVFERLWAETGCRAVIAELASGRKHGFAVERAVLLTVLHRLFAGGSDRAADRWREDYAIRGTKDGVFKFPFVTIEGVDLVDGEHIVLANDNNLPYSAGRKPNLQDETNSFRYVSPSCFAHARRGPRHPAARFRRCCSPAPTR